MSSSTAMEFRRGKQEWVVALSGALDAESLPPIWARARAALRESGGAPLRVDATGVTYCDGSGIAFLLDLRREGLRHGSRVTITNLAPRFAELLGQFDRASLDDEGQAPPQPPRLIERIGRAVLQLGADLRRQSRYVRRVTSCLLYELRRPSVVRWK